MPWGPKWNQQSSFILKSGSPLIQVKAVEAAKKSTSSSPPQWAPSAKQMLLNGIICLFLQTPTTANDRNFIYFVVRKLENFFELRTFYFTINSILEASIVKALELDWTRQEFNIILEDIFHMGHTLLWNTIFCSEIPITNLTLKGLKILYLGHLSFRRRKLTLQLAWISSFSFNILASVDQVF